MLIAVSFIAATALHAQPREYNIILPAFFSRNGTGLWSNGGGTASEVGIRTAPLMNPALLRQEGNSIYLEFGKQFRSKYLAGMDIDGQLSLPNFGSVTFGFESFSLCAGYGEVFHHAMSTRDFSVTTVEQPEGTGEYFQVNANRIVRTVFASAAFRSGEWISAGITAGYNFALMHDEVWQTTMEGTGGGLMFVAGILLRPVPFLTVGSSVALPEKISLKTSNSATTVQLYDPDTSSAIKYAVLAAPSFLADMPLTVNTGVTIIPSKMFLVSFGYRFTEWSESIGFRDHRDTYEYSAGASISISDEVTVRCGWFGSRNPSTIETTDSVFSIPLDQDFWTAGVRWIALPAIELSLTVVNGYRSALEDFHQGNVLAGVSHDF